MKFQRQTVTGRQETLREGARSGEPGAVGKHGMVARPGNVLLAVPRQKRDVPVPNRYNSPGTRRRFQFILRTARTSNVCLSLKLKEETTSCYYSERKRNKESPVTIVQICNNFKEQIRGRHEYFKGGRYVSRSRRASIHSLHIIKR